jgi:hypothetical protein
MVIAHADEQLFVVIELDVIVAVATTTHSAARFWRDEVEDVQQLRHLDLPFDRDRGLSILGVRDQ